MIYNFGDIWIFNQYLKKTGLESIINSIIPDSCDTFKALIGYRLLESGGYNHTIGWYEGSYASILYPQAKLSSPSISEFFTEIGTDEFHNNFFQSYLPISTKNIFINNQISIPILLDSTGSQNDIKIDLNQLNNYNGQINNEIRLIYVVDKNTKLPIYFRIVSGNVIDNTTLINTLNMLSGYNINVELTIMDAGYYTENNVCQLISSKTAFITRIIQNSKEYKNLMENYGANLLISDNLITYGDRVLFGKKVPIILFGSQLFVYILLDLNNFTKNITKDAFQYDEDPNKSDKINDSLSSSGKFILLSNNNYEISEILPLYYTRQYIEQAFDVSNTYNNILPLRIHSKETLDGSILISFIASILYTIINNDFNKSKYSAIEAFTFMKNVRIEVFESYKIISELTKIQKDISNVLNLDVPFELEEGNRYKKNSYIAQLKNKNDKRGRPKGSKNKVKNIITDNNKKLDVTTSKRGRPKGSKNKDCLTIL